MRRNSYKRKGKKKTCSLLFLTFTCTGLIQVSAPSFATEKWNFPGKWYEKNLWFSGHANQHVSIKLKVKIIHSSMKSPMNKYVFLSNSVKIDTVKTINYPGIIWIVHVNKTTSLLALLGECCCRAMPISIVVVTHRWSIMSCGTPYHPVIQDRQWTALISGVFLFSSHFI